MVEYNAARCSQLVTYKNENFWDGCLAGGGFGGGGNWIFVPKKKWRTSVGHHGLNLVSARRKTTPT